jgi:hypothetical protein
MTNLTISSNNCQVSLELDCDLTVTELSQLIVILRELVDNATSEDLVKLSARPTDAVLTMIDSVYSPGFTIPEAILKLIK